VEILLIIALGIGLALFVQSRQQNRRRELEAADAVSKVRKVAEEDVVRLGEDLQALDVAVAGRELDEGARQDYRRALDAYDAAKAALDAVRTPEDVRGVTEALEDGRYAAACVLARLDGRPLPARRPPCFFNPQHGPSAEDVPWAPPGGIKRDVPACAADAERVRAGAEPDSRKVLVGSQRRNYWEAGPTYAPWASGYFAPYAMSGLLPGVLMGAMLTGGFGGWDGGSGDGGSGEGGDAGDQGDGGDGGEGGGDYADGGGDYGSGDSGGDFGGGGFDGGGFDGGGFGDFGGGFGDF
jgi:hypothetical protein